MVLGVWGVTGLRRASVWYSFKFPTNIKQPFVLRASRAPWPYRFLLAAMKVIAEIPRKLFRLQLHVDCNERIVEVPFVLQHLISPAGMRILDFGCAESVLPIFLATQGAEVVGVDLRDYEFEHPNFSFHKGDLFDRGYPPESFDAVVAVSVVEHCGLKAYGSRTFERGDVRAMEECKRVLKIGGVVILTVPFGKHCMNDELRIYDSHELNGLTAGFRILKRQFYRKSAGGTYWFQCSEEEAAGAGWNPVTGVQGVALMLCKKPSEGDGATLDQDGAEADEAEARVAGALRPNVECSRGKK